MAKCRWCNLAYDANQFPSFGDYCSRACEEAVRRNGKEKWDQFAGGWTNVIQNQVQIAQLEQQHALTEEQNALIAEQNQRFAAEEAERQQWAALAKREATWKQFLFEVNESFDELTDQGDEVSMLAQGEWFRHKSEEWQFSESDLSEIGDKRYFAETRRRVESIWKGATEKSHSNYKKFKTLYLEYQGSFAGRSVFPEANSEAFQEKVLLKKFNKSKPTKSDLTEEQLAALIEPPQELVELQRKRKYYGWGLVACMASNLVFPGFAFLPAMGIYFFGIHPLNGLLKPLEEKFQQDLEEARKKRIALDELNFKRATKIWQSERRDFETNLPKANLKIEEHNRTVKKRYEAAQKKWQNRKQTLVDTINNYLDRHSSLEKWFPRVGNEQ